MSDTIAACYDSLMVGQRDCLIGAVLFGSTAIALALLWIPSGLGPTHFNYYQLYWDSILQGRLWVVESRDGRCPYDLIEYRGACYLYWGILPAFFHAIPGMTDRLWSILAGTGAVYFFLKIFSDFKFSFPSKTSRVYFYLFGVLNPLLATVVCGWVYGESIAFSLLFGFWGLSRRSHWPSSLFLFGMAALCRATWFPVLGLATVYASFRSFGIRRAFVWFPLLGFVGLQLLLNQMRFGSPTEFGVSFYTSHLDGPQGLSWTAGLYSWKAVFWNMMSYGFTGFPGEISLLSFFRGPLYSEFPLGLLIAIPGLAMGFVRFKQLEPTVRRRLFKLFLLVSPLSLFVLFQTTQTWRYETEHWLIYFAVGFLPLVGLPFLSAREKVFHRLALGWGVILSLWNTYLIVSTRLHQL